MSDSTVSQVRAFNRFYTRQLGLLDEHIAQSRFSLAEGRVLYEIAQRGTATSRDLAETLGLDAAYLSRIVHKLGDLGLVRVAASPDDRRSNAISVTPTGASAVDDLINLNERAVEQVLRPVDPARRGDLVAAMQAIQHLFGETPPTAPKPIVLRGHRLGELGWLIHRQGLVYNQQFGWNIEFEALIARIYSEFQFAPPNPPKNLWVAEQGGSIVGSIFVMPTDGLTGSAQLRMLYVEPSARGQGVGTALVKQAVGFARDNGYARMRLWTHTNQQSARKIYAAAGFSIVETMPEFNFGKQLMGEIWELAF